MATPTVRDVMTDTVVAVRERAHYKEVVAALIDNGISSVPVLDSDDRVVGVVTEADLLPKVEFSGDDPRVKLFERRRPARVEAAGDDAGALMSSPVVGLIGVVDVLEELTWRDDDTGAARRRYGFDGEV